MKTIPLPQKPKYTKTGENSGKFEIMGCYPGYGTTLGNALRRILISSLEGAAITSVKIKGVTHEFSTIKGVLEDAVQIILNLKKIRFKMYGSEPVKVSLKSKKEGKITAKDIKASSSIEVINTDQIIANVTDKKTELELEMEVNRGLGYIPVEQQEKENKEIGSIAIDAVYTPIRRVNYEVENMRVGKRTDYDKITLEIVTDGSLTPQEAFSKAAQILVDQFSTLLKISEGEVALEKEEVKTIKKEEAKGEISEDPKEIEVDTFKNLSTRTLNVLEENKIKKVKDILKLSEEELGNLEGMGKKGIKEIKKAIGEFGLTLKSHS
jgi:DNA-directed RNA polymerase subunit alpha